MKQSGTAWARFWRVDGTDAVQKAVALRPDIILVDVSMPGLNGFDGAGCILSDYQNPKF